MVKKRKFGKIADRIASIKENAGSSFIMLEEDNYNALCVGVTYREDVEREFSGELKTSDIITYLFHIPTEDGVANLRKEYTVSAYKEKAKLPQMLEKFGIEDIEEFHQLMGETVRVGVAEKTSKQGKDYNIIEKIIPAKKNVDEIEIDKLELPAFFIEDTDPELIEVVEGVVFTQPKKKRKLKQVEELVDEDQVESEIVVGDSEDNEEDFYNELKKKFSDSDEDEDDLLDDM